MIPVVPLHEAQPRPRRVAVGEFDGVHLGHREVIRGADTVLTFDPHPRMVVAPDSAPKLLNTLEQKAELVAELGVDELVVIEFDRTFAAQSPQEFIDAILVGQLQATHVSVGENFRFGHRAQGDTQLLSQQESFGTRIADLVELDGEVVSSTHIRGLITGGEVERANRFLGSAFELRGIVRHGDKRGRELGYPTANLVPDSAYVAPDHGIYATLCSTDGEEWVPAATNVGVRPTFATGRGLLIEAYLIGWSGDLYDRELRVRFLQRLRGERRFASADALVEQMALDVERAAEVTATLLRRS